MSLLGARLGAFVMVPTVIAGFYFYDVATPMYSSHSEFLVLKADSLKRLWLWRPAERDAIRHQSGFHRRSGLSAIQGSHAPPR